MLKIVRFDIYCPECKYEKQDEYTPPCDECLEVGGRDDTYEPLYFKEKEK